MDVSTRENNPWSVFQQSRFDDTGGYISMILILIFVPLYPIELSGKYPVNL